MTFDNICKIYSCEESMQYEYSQNFWYGELLDIEDMTKLILTAVDLSGVMRVI